MADAELVVRTLDPDEWQIHRDLRLAALGTDPHAFGSTLDDYAQLSEDDWRHRCDDHSWFAFLDRKPVGMARLYLAADHVEIISMWVAPEARRQGVATALIDAAKDAAAHHGDHVSVWVVDDNAPAIALYRSLGFHVTPLTERQPDGRVELEMATPTRPGAAITRRATASDIDAFVSLRAAMFEAMHVTEQDAGWRGNAAAWLTTHLDDPECCFVVVDVDGQVVASAMGQVRDSMPSPTVPDGGDVLVNNVCVLPGFRGQGHGRRAFDAVMAWARTTSAGRAELLATPDGLPMYERSGFTPTTWPCMRKELP